MSWGDFWDLEDSRPYVARFRTKIRIPTTTSTLQVMTGAGTLLALVVEETTGTAGARFELWDGGSTGGEYMGPWTLLSGQSFDNNYTIYGLPFRNGLFLNVTTGSAGGVMYIGTHVLWNEVHGGED
jgi:hypothetical protein